MLLFNYNSDFVKRIKQIFKYISCYCSTNYFSLFSCLQAKFKYISCYCSTAVIREDGTKDYVFKYISCYCSTPFGLNILSHKPYLNTSHVIVQQQVYMQRLCKERFKYISYYCSTAQFQRSTTS